eukprot:gene10506-14118_t
MPSSQKKIRDLERYLRRKNVEPSSEESASVTAKIDSLKTDLALHKQGERDRRHAIKYHLVKFVERKKVVRMIRNCDGKLKELSEIDGSSSKKAAKQLRMLQKERASLEDDLTYIMYYPNERKYMALFPSSDAEQTNEKESASKGPTIFLTEDQLTLQMKIRKEAAELRSSAIRMGQQDKVAHAIEVGNNPKTIKQALNEGNNSNSTKRPKKNDRKLGDMVIDSNEENENEGIVDSHNSDDDQSNGKRKADDAIVESKSKKIKKNIKNKTENFDTIPVNISAPPVVELTGDSFFLEEANNSNETQNDSVENNNNDMKIKNKSSSHIKKALYNNKGKKPFSRSKSYTR